MQKKESSILGVAKVIVVASSVIGIFTIWGICYYMLVMSAENRSQVPNSQIVFTKSACAKIIANKLAQGDCYMKVAKTRKDETICSNIEIAELRSLCFVELAELKNDSGICKNNGLTPSILTVCQEYFGMEKKSDDVTSGSSDSDDWKTYRNDAYGYSFSYPADWKITVSDIDPSTIADNDLNKIIEGVHDVALNDEAVMGPVFALEIMNKTIDNAIAADKSVYGARTGNPVTIGGVVGEKLAGAFYGMQYVNRKGKTYFFEQENANSDADERDFDKVMESFKFVSA